MKKMLIIVCLILLPQLVFGGELYSYQKVSDDFTTFEMLTGETQAVELGTVDGVTYVWLVDNSDMTVQPKQIIPTIAVLTPEVKATLLKVSPYLKLTQARLLGEVPQVRYSEDDEILLKSLTDLLIFESATLITHVDSWRTWAVEAKVIEK